MRRAAIRPGRRSLERRSTFRAKPKGLERRVAPSRKAGRREHHRELVALRSELRELWAQHARSQPCPITGKQDGEDGCRLDGHHVCERQWIKDVARRRGYTAEQLIRALYDTRNDLGVEHIAHLQHHAFSRQGAARIPRAVVLERCPEVLDFAREHGLEDRFDAAYPEVP